MKSSRWFLSAVALLVGTGCAENAAPAGLQFGEPRPSEPGISVEIENETPSSVREFVVLGGSEIPLGRVTALATRSFRVPSSAGNFRLLVRPSALDLPGSFHSSEVIQAVSGQHVTWELKASPGTTLLPRTSVVRVFACAGGSRC